MYAALVTLTIDPAQASAVASGFTNEILPRIQRAPGFVRGYWLDPVEGEGFGFVLFDSEENARRATPPSSDWSAPGVAITRVGLPARRGRCPWRVRRSSMKESFRRV